MKQILHKMLCECINHTGICLPSETICIFNLFLEEHFLPNVLGSHLKPQVPLPLASPKPDRKETCPALHLSLLSLEPVSLLRSVILLPGFQETRNRLVGSISDRPSDPPLEGAGEEGSGADGAAAGTATRGESSELLPILGSLVTSA